MKGSLGTIAGRRVSVRMVLPVTLSLESAPALLAGMGPTATGVSIHCTHTYVIVPPFVTPLIFFEGKGPGTRGLCRACFLLHLQPVTKGSMVRGAVRCVCVRQDTATQ